MNMLIKVIMYSNHLAMCIYIFKVISLHRYTFTCQLHLIENKK